MLNEVQGGRGIPVKFSLTGFKGYAIFAPGYPRSQITACGSALVSGVEETVTAGSSSLS